jgi:uncharacterized small protein (DUF1192 family)
MFGPMSRRRRRFHRYHTLSEALEAYTVDELKGFARLLLDQLPRRKAELVEQIGEAATGSRLPPSWSG